ncbi:MAG TPA: carboxymuconolactone decarboxylase family protein [Thermomicrobiales bacterium]|nr:carboxymuconolactone decarboxylase family protein [Thermomicrobiales bacterium]
MTTRIIDQEPLNAIVHQIAQLERYLRTASIEAHLLHLIKLRVSQINGCAFCLSMHTRDLLNAGERADRIAVLPAWRETDWFTPRERAALAWAEALTTLANREVPEHTVAEARAELNETELADLTIAVIAINGWNRYSIAYHVAPAPFEIAPAEAAAIA